MTADEPPSESLTLWEKLSLTWLVPLFAARCIKFLLCQRNPSLHWRQNLALALLKVRRATYPAKYLHHQARRVPTGKAIELYVSQHPNIAHTTVTVPLPPSSNPQLKDVLPPVLHFLTPVTGQNDARTNSKTTLLYFHGGGFVNPLRAAGHMPFILSLHKASQAHQTIILEYALAPEHPYPAQLIQAVAALSYLLTDLSLTPSDIILAGDSAGGQLVGALLAHLAKPSPYAPQVEGWKKAQQDQFKAAVFVSPWASMQRPGGVSMFEKADDKWDYLTEGQCARYQQLWDPKVDEVWANLCSFSEGRDTEEEEEVWGRVFGRDGRRAMVKKTLVTVGTAEVLLESCQRFGRECVGGETVVVDRDTTSTDLEKEVKGREVVTVECVGDAHVQPTLDAAVEYEEGVMMRVSAAWLGGV